MSRYDAFICHASDDKKRFVRPLAEALSSLGARIWYDEFSLKIGDSISEGIDKGLAQSTHGIVVISPAFLKRPWPKHELRGLVTRAIDGRLAILPVWHDVSQAEVSDFSPTLADRLAVKTSEGTAVDIAIRILAVIRRDLYDQHPRAELEKRANGTAIAELEEELSALRERLSDYQCTYCGSPLVASVPAPVDDAEKHWDVREEFECGYVEFGGAKEALCPSDPAFPRFEDFELHFLEQTDFQPSVWLCNALPLSRDARLVHLSATPGRSKDDAATAMRRQFEARATRWS